jgi:hypothetical protein
VGRTRLGSPGERIDVLQRGVAPPGESPPNPLDPAEGGLVYHIVTPRPGTEVAGKALTCRWRSPKAEGAPNDGKTEQLNWQILGNINTYNRDARRLHRRLSAKS